MLTFNMFIEKNLINDSMSIVVNVIWDNDTDDSFTTLSAVVLIKMNDYVDSISMLINNQNVVSIFLRTATWNNDDNTCFYEQFSLILIFAIIIHKSQKLILVKVILNLAMLNFCQDLTYVNLSQVHQIQDLAFKISFFYDHFFRRNDESIFKRINDNHHQQRLTSLFFFFLNVNVWFMFVVKIKEFELVKTALHDFIIHSINQREMIKEFEWIKTASCNFIVYSINQRKSSSERWKALTYFYLSIEKTICFIK